MRIVDGRLDDDKTRSKQPVITEPHTDRPSDGSRMVGGACRSEDHNVSPRKKLSTPQNSCIAIGRERVTIVSISWNISHFCFAVRWNERLFLLAFLFGGDTEVLEDFSPLSTNATYWETYQDTLKGQRHRAR